MKGSATMTDINKEYEKEYYDEYRNNYYNPDDDDGEPGINLNWKRIQKGFHNVAGNDTETAETLSGMQSVIGTLSEDVDTLKTDVDEIKESVDDLNTALSNEVNDLKNALNDKADAIITETSQAYNHSGLGLSTNIRFIGNQYAFTNAIYANNKNVFPNLTGGTTTTGGTTITRSGRFLEISNTATSSNGTQIYNGNVADIDAGNYKLIVIFDLGESVISTSNNGQFIVSIDGTRYQNYVSLSEQRVIKTYDVTVSSSNPKVYATASVIKDNVYSGFKIWYGLYPADTVFTDTGETVENNTTFDYSVSVDYSVIDTYQHESIISVVADTKTYLESYEPTLANQHYLTPEMYGAVGDGVANDTTALQQCISDAISNRIPMRAYGKYKTTSMLTFQQSPSNAGRNYSFEINRIEYSGNDNYAININGSCGRFIFGYISSNTGGILLSSIFNNAVLNYIFANSIYSNNVCFRTEGISGWVIYNTIRILRPNSINGNCFENGTNAGENRYYDSSCACSNGWGIYGVNGRYYNFGLESNVKNGIYAKTGDAGSLLSFRWQELADSYSESVRGTVLKVVGEGVHIRIIGPELPLTCIDVSDMYTVSQITRSSYKYKGIIISASIVAGQHPSRHLGHGAYIRCGKIICVPEIEKSLFTVTTSSLDLRSTDPIGYPTKFVINEDTNIYLSDSYCPIGVTSFVIDQTNGKLCNVYKSDETQIFNGTTLGSGVYELTSYCDSAGPGSIAYDTTNDIWEVRKLS